MKPNTTFLVDAGNSRIKVSCALSPQLVQYASAEPLSIANWIGNQPCQSVWLASVRRPDALSSLIDSFKSQGISVNQVETQTQDFGLSNSYDNARTMGVDRWLSMVAVHQVEPLPFAVLMFGTAITCDFVRGGQHQGGWIVPGRDLMQNALTKNTARVFCEQKGASQFGIGQSTPNCVSFGCFAAARGVIQSAREWLQQNWSQHRIYVTGGDVNIISSVEQGDIINAENLVLQGLAHYAKRNKCDG